MLFLIFLSLATQYLLGDTWNKKYTRWFPLKEDGSMVQGKSHCQEHYQYQTSNRPKNLFHEDLHQLVTDNFLLSICLSSNSSLSLERQR